QNGVRSESSVESSPLGTTKQPLNVAPAAAHASSSASEERREMARRGERLVVDMGNVLRFRGGAAAAARPVPAAGPPPPPLRSASADVLKKRSRGSSLLVRR